MQDKKSKQLLHKTLFCVLNSKEVMKGIRWVGTQCIVTFSGKVGTYLYTYFCWEVEVC